MAERGERDTKGGDRKSKFHEETLIPPKLEDLGVTKTQSSWQKLADIPEERFEEELAAEMPSTAGIISAVTRRTPRRELRDR
jgi:hypothetical protein